jgi:tetratricopeptide (TPR) repeat protein
VLTISFISPEKFGQWAMRKTTKTQQTWIRSNPARLFLVVSAVWTLILYWKAIFNPFSSYDDTANIVTNSRLTSWAGIIYYLRTNVSFVGDLRGSGESYYRPLYWISLALDRKLWGVSAVAFHLTNVILHWLNGFLLFTLLRRVRVPLRVAACTVLLWLVLPINSEVVAWVSARAYLLVALFVLLSALLAQRFLEAKRVAFLAGYGLTALCALLCHEAGILVFPLTVLIGYALDKYRTRSALTLYSVAATGTAIYFGVRHLIGTSGEYRQPVAVAPFGIFFFKYLGWLVLPVRMSIERSTNTPLDRLSAPALVAWAATLAVFIIVFLIRRKWPMVAAALAWTCIATLPFCGLVPIYQGMAERFLYFASVGVAFLVAAMGVNMQSSARSIVLSIFAVWVLWGIWRLHDRLLDWSDSIRLYQSSLEASPNSTKLLYNVGAVSEQRGDLATADRSYLFVLHIKPNFEQAIAGLANIRLRRNIPQQAAPLYRKALAIKPDDVLAATNYAASLQELGDLPNAAAEYRRAIALAPMTDDAYCGLGVLLFQEGDSVGATAQFLEAQKLNPSDPTPHYDLGAVYQKFGRPLAAENEFKKALDLNPGDPDALAALQLLESRKGPGEKATP